MVGGGDEGECRVSINFHLCRGRFRPRRKIEIEYPIAPARPPMFSPFPFFVVGVCPCGVFVRRREIDGGFFKTVICSLSTEFAG